ncbi:MAG: hypothetical protein E6J29_07420, partial [Chloroflexi bacterium]
TQPAIYFGEGTSNYALAPSAQKEFDYPSGSGDVYTHYSGTHGVPLSGANRLLYAAYMQDLNLLITTQVNDKTQILYRRNIVDRVNDIAPFLTFDSDPYVVVADGKVYWIIDGYTNATSYPYSQSESSAGVNYIRNSVKVVIDVYEGTANFYVADPSDPLLKSRSTRCLRRCRRTSATRRTSSTSSQPSTRPTTCATRRSSTTRRTSGPSPRSRPGLARATRCLPITC